MNSRLLAASLALAALGATPRPASAGELQFTPLGVAEHVRT